MAENENDQRSFATTPTWSLATVLTVFVAVSLLAEHLIHLIDSRLRKSNRKPLLHALEKMKEELMLLGFISLLLTATSRTITNICIPSRFYDDTFAPCTRSEIVEETENKVSQNRKLLMGYILPVPLRRRLSGRNRSTCKEGHEPFFSYEGIEQLHRFIFIMAITHISYSCLTMLLAIVKIHGWRVWEDRAHKDQPDYIAEITKESTMRRQSVFVNFHMSNPLVKNGFVWVTCFLRQFGPSVVRSDYLTLRRGFINNHNLTLKYDFHSYMICSMEEEFQKIVSVSAPLWGFAVAFMLFNVKGSNLYLWILIIPMALVLLVGTKLQHVIATLSIENAGITGFCRGTKLKPRDDLFWFKKPELLLSLIHFILFQNAFELASFLWFWWQFGFHSCFISNHTPLYFRLVLGFAIQFLCSYSTLPLYALVTQMGTNYKAALIPERIRETMHVWGEATRRKKRHRIFTDARRTSTCTVVSIEEDDHQFPADPANSTDPCTEIEIQPAFSVRTTTAPVSIATSSRVGTNYKTDSIPQRLTTRTRRKNRHGTSSDDSPILTNACTVVSIEEDDRQILDDPANATDTCTKIESQPTFAVTTTTASVANETSNRVDKPLPLPSASISSTAMEKFQKDSSTIFYGN